MHTCLHTSPFLNKLPYPTERERGTVYMGRRRRGSARTCTTAPCTCLGAAGEEGGRIRRVSCQRCGLEGGGINRAGAAVPTFLRTPTMLQPHLDMKHFLQFPMETAHHPHSMNLFHNFNTPLVDSIHISSNIPPLPILLLRTLTTSEGPQGHCES
ncbi:Zinc finger protein 385D [Dissostichus eleginoides]|uniref:Zinc finger protein 385D n=1 Tax=Dissostichus eleginoides TaxID=100907 RepID=A0AAD9C9D3_DISEL|nr:Zinc finger protein 385D [Dissostichus eleginoides]